jgi:hypothetical protein
MKTNKYNLVIGIDTGTHTGVAVWDRSKKQLHNVATMKIHEALNYVSCTYHDYEPNILVRVEDARKRKFITGGREKLQGAGSIKRDAVIWEDFLKDLGCDFEMVAPKDNKTKMKEEYFKKVTGWQGRTSEHARDAVFLCYGF